LFEVENYSINVAQYVRSNLQMQMTSTRHRHRRRHRPSPPPPEPSPKSAPPPQAANEPPPPRPHRPKPGKVLTSDPDPDAPVDLTGDGFVTGNGEFHGGITSGTGTAKTAARDIKAVPSGTPGGTGTGSIAVAKAPDKDLSRPAMPMARAVGTICPFPAEAQLDGIEFARVTLVATINTDGRAKSVVIVSDPGSGFGFPGSPMRHAQDVPGRARQIRSGDCLEHAAVHSYVSDVIGVWFCLPPHRGLGLPPHRGLGFASAQGSWFASALRMVCLARGLGLPPHFAWSVSRGVLVCPPHFAWSVSRGVLVASALRLECLAILMT